MLPTDELLELSLHRERAAMVVEDLRALPAAPVVVAEGSSLPAAAVPDPSRAVWLLPSAEFQAAQLASRPLSDGHRRLYLRLREVIEVEARERGVPTLVIDGTRPIEGAVTAVESRFAGALATGAGATTVAERQVLLREANQAVVEQVRGYFARPWADGDAEAVLQPFLCECGAPTCDAEVETTVGAAAAGPLRAERGRPQGLPP